MARPLKTTPLVCFDVETTGLDMDRDRIVEIAIVHFTLEEVLTSFESLVNPNCAIPAEATAIHHITETMVVNQPTMTQLLPKIMPLLENQVFVGHGISFDVEMVCKASERAGIPCNLRTAPFLDTLRLARLYGESPNNTLETLRAHFQIPANQAHRAMSDVMVNIEVFRHLVRRYQTVEQVFQALSKPIEMKLMPLGKHKGRPMRDLPIDYLRWAVRQSFDQDLLYSLQRELGRRKEGNLFTQASNPFKNI
jgi:DNA polymerase-3 subunit epsilon